MAYLQHLYSDELSDEHPRLGPRIGFPEDKMPQQTQQSGRSPTSPMDVLTDVAAQFFNHQRMQQHTQQQMYGNAGNGEGELYRQPPYSSQQLLLNSYLNEDGYFVDDAPCNQGYPVQQTMQCRPTTWQAASDMMRHQWDQHSESRGMQKQYQHDQHMMQSAVHGRRQRHNQERHMMQSGMRARQQHANLQQWDQCTGPSAQQHYHQQQQAQQQLLQQHQQQEPQRESAPSVLLGLVQNTPPQTPPSEVEAPSNCRPGGMGRSEIVIRNTFLTSPPVRSPSLEPFYKERLVKSNPASGPPSGPSSGTVTPLVQQPPTRQLPAWLQRSDFAEGACTRYDRRPGYAAAAAAARLSRELANGGVERSTIDCQSEASSAIGSAKQVSRTGASAEWQGGQPARHLDPVWRSDGALEVGAGAVAPELGSPEYPSRGSAMHRLGACKPCAFVVQEKEGCMNGVDCQFCHLCEPGEKKRRKKERLMIRREARQEARKVRQQLSMGWN